MKWIEAKVSFDHSGVNLIADMISNVFYELGLQGVVVDDPGLETEEDWAEDAVARPTRHAIIGYFHKDNQTNWRCETLETRLVQLKQKLGFFYHISYKELDEQDWAFAWKTYFRPQKIGNRIVIKPTWRRYRAGADDIIIELDPGMAFGTGTHPTTALCISMIETHLRRGDAFLDVGTGSGILMIAAAKLGAGRLCGIDKDEVALEVAGNNLTLNRIEPDHYRLIAGNLVSEINECYRFVVANINTHVILKLLQDVKAVLEEGGILVCSGIILDNQHSVISEMERIGFEILNREIKEEWVAIAGRLKVKG